MFGITLVLIIAIMGGLIAYIGDKLGTKVGKKKLSIFGLRPKHTSIVVTIITGILISASTLGILALTSQNVRTALFGMEALKAQLTDLSTSVSRQKQELESSRQALADKTAEYSAMSDKVADVAAKLSAATEQLTAVTAERDKTLAALAAVNEELTAAEGNLQMAHSEIAALQQTKQGLEAKLVSLGKTMKTLEADKTNLEKDVTQLQDVTAKLRAGLQTVREGTVIYRSGEVIGNFIIAGGKNREETTASLQGDIYDLNQSMLDKLQIADKSIQVLWIPQGEFNQIIDAILQSEQDAIVRIVAADNTVYGEPVIGHFELYPNKLIYSTGTVVHSEVISPIANAQQAEETVLAFLRRVNEQARKQGILPDPLQGTVGTISGSQLFEAVNKVKRYTGPVELKAVTVESIYSAGPLKIEIKVQPSFGSQ
ncbi:MAG: DUF3084 domain-containing protein [Sporomusaceae bacterium]|nr:DUF3084 domain-containing protein [Sporomusaceae bacterium]